MPEQWADSRRVWRLDIKNAGQQTMLAGGSLPRRTAVRSMILR
ncbi:hypothetical protein HMPREF1861_01116 [Corynebacterium kroppenstedtii]|nr:hypothetical protein HMPREF1861_01116 [Corynebacterium kroppenstedtii]